MTGYDDGYQSLFRFLAQQVETPQGSGRLEQVLGPDCVRVTLDTQADASQESEDDAVQLEGDRTLSARRFTTGG